MTYAVSSQHRFGTDLLSGENRAGLMQLGAGSSTVVCRFEEDSGYNFRNVDGWSHLRGGNVDRTGVRNFVQSFGIQRRDFSYDSSSATTLDSSGAP
jgi:hypothetical protein